MGRGSGLCLQANCQIQDYTCLRAEFCVHCCSSRHQKCTSKDRSVYQLARDKGMHCGTKRCHLLVPLLGLQWQLSRRSVQQRVLGRVHSAGDFLQVNHITHCALRNSSCLLQPVRFRCVAVQLHPRNVLPPGMPGLQRNVCAGLHEAISSRETSLARGSNRRAAALTSGCVSQRLD